MLRRPLLAMSRSARLRRIVSNVRATRAVAERFVAGETLAAALDVVARLNAGGMPVTLDYLGESVTDPVVARRGAQVYLDALDAIAARGLDCSVSVKPTQLGLDIAFDLAFELLVELCARAEAVGTHVTLDMELPEHVQPTLDLVTQLHAAGHANVGCAVQSYLRRTADDVLVLDAASASLRLCKGAYDAGGDIAFTTRDEISASYLRLAETLLLEGTFPRFATHDHRLIAAIRNLAVRHGVGKDAFEFQMLYGIREPLQLEVVAGGNGMRIYVPFGDEWYPYLTRRLAERPANLTFFLRALVGRRAPRPAG